jgi:hypothetical protein
MHNEYTEHKRQKIKSKILQANKTVTKMVRQSRPQFLLGGSANPHI